jgi:hypothetical protein
MSFGGDGTGGTPDADSILAQPPLQESPSAQQDSAQEEGQAAESMCPNQSDYLDDWPAQALKLVNTLQVLILP